MLSQALLAGLCGVSLAVLPPSPAVGGIRQSQQWVLDMLRVQAAWRRTEGAGVTVAVIDSGVYPGTSDLSGSVIEGPDDSGVRTPPSNPGWGMHGTWMASLIAGHGGTSGIVGVAPRARVLSVRVILDRDDPNYGRYEHEPEPRIQDGLAAGIDYAVAHRAQVISMSIGYVAPSGAVKRALQRAYDHGVVVVASAGNSGDAAGTSRVEAPDSFPAEYPGVIGVSAVDINGAVAGFSSDNLSVRVAAPGVNVPAQGRDGAYWSVSGTSPACALVAGVAALIKSAYPSLPPQQVAIALTSTTTERPAAGYDSKVGFGIADAAAALAKAGWIFRHPPAVTGISAAARYRGPAVADPVRPRGSGQLAAFAALAAACLALTGGAAARLRRRRR
jgi:subtilisin family serine protease